MEPLPSLATGFGGRPLGTERPSALFPASSGPSSGQMFAREVERARERAQGDGLQARRLDELEEDHRNARRASFGQERSPRGLEARAERSIEPPQAGTIAEADPAEGTGGVADVPVAPSSNAAAPVEPESQGAALAKGGENPGASAWVTGATAAAPATGSTPAALGTGELRATAPGGAALPDAEPAALAQILRLAQGKNVRAATPAQARAAPDPALLERAGEILRQIRLHLSPLVRRLTLDLEPAELGKISVQLALRAGKVDAIVRAEHERTLELLQVRSAELRALFEQQGIEADSIRLELGFGRERGARARAGLAVPTGAGARGTAGPPATAATTPPALRRSLNTLVDTYA